MGPKQYLHSKGPKNGSCLFNLSGFTGKVGKEGENGRKWTLFVRILKNKIQGEV